MHINETTEKLDLTFPFINYWNECLPQARNQRQDGGGGGGQSLNFFRVEF